MIYFKTILLSLTAVLFTHQVMSQSKNAKVYEKSYMPCDTIVLKNGASELAKISKVGDASIVYYECRTEGALPRNATNQTLLHKNNVDTIHYGTIKSYKYRLIDSKKRLYFDATLGLNFPKGVALINTFFFERNKTYTGIFDIHNSASLSYQFKPYLGLGITVTNDIIFDYTNDVIRNLLADYRVNFGRHVLTGHVGMVSKSSKVTADYCDISIDASKPRPAFGISYKRLAYGNTFLGVRLFYSEIPTNETCYSVPLQKKVFSNSHKNYVYFNITGGLYFPKRFTKEYDFKPN